MNKYVVAVFLGICTVSLAHAQQKRTVNIAAGQKFQVENSLNATASQELLGQSMESVMSMKLLNSVEVKSKADSGFGATNTVIRITGKMTAMEQEMNFDSDDKKDTSFTKGNMKDVMNKPRQVFVYKDGRVISKEPETKASGSDDVIGSMGQQLMGDPNDPAFGVTDIFITLPVKTSQGYNWSDSSSGDGMKRSTTYQVKSIANGVATITFKGTIAGETKGEMMSVEMINKTNGTIDGEETVDLKTGMLKTRNSVTTVKGTITAAGQDIPITSKIVAATVVKSL